MKQKKTSISIRSIALLMALVLVIGICFVVPSQAAADTGNVGKLVDYFQANSSTLTLNANSRFFLEVEPTGELLQTVQLAQRQFAEDGTPSATPMPIVWGDPAMVRSGDIFIQITNDGDIGAEGYKIIATDRVKVIAEDVDGLLYGLNMLQKHFRNGNSNSIKGFTTYDTPDTLERTCQLDCARKYLTVEYVCNFIKEMSWMGYNTLQLHVSEDGGFRADFWDENYYVEGHYQPENDLSWVCGSHVQSWVKDETSNGGKNYRNDPDANKYLTTAELIQIIETCKEYHIDVIPSFDSPAHMDYLNWKFEQNYKSNTSYFFTYNGEEFKASATSGCINYSGTTGGASPTWPYYTCMDIRDNTTRGKMSQAFVKTIYSNMADFFKYYAGSKYFVIGADEPNLYNSAIKNTAWRYSLLPGYINEINAILESKGYTARVFNDFLNASALSTLDDDIQILYWNTPYNSISGTDKAYTVDYINDSGTYVEDPMVTVAQYVSDGRTIFNCVNQHTYYVLRIGVGNTTDARSATCYNWEFYGATEESIYNNWFPNNIRKKGKFTEGDRIVPTSQLGGAYFLTWHDYAAVNTETEIWNGVSDSVANTGEFYSVRYRMWSNIIKMWNHDINNSLSFSDFATIRNSLGDFPGLKSDTYTHASYAKATTLSVAATDPIQLADHTALTAAVANKLSKGVYTDESYEAYETAFNEAVYINNQNTATAEQLGAALQKLLDAQENLVLQTKTLTVYRRTIINGTTYTIDTLTYSIVKDTLNYNFFIPTLEGYKYLRAEEKRPENASATDPEYPPVFTLSETGDGSGYLSGPIGENNLEINIFYENQVDTSRLDNLLANPITEQTSPDGSWRYTDASWSVYCNALKAAQEFELTINSQQATVLALVKALENARTALVVESDTMFIKLEPLASSFNKDGQIGLYVYTSCNIPNLVFAKDGSIITPDVLTGEVQALNTGEIVKYWLVFLPATEAGEFTYSASYGNTTTNITVTVG